MRTNRTGKRQEEGGRGRSDRNAAFPRRGRDRLRSSGGVYCFTRSGPNTGHLELNVKFVLCTYNKRTVWILKEKRKRGVNCLDFPQLAENTPP